MGDLMIGRLVNDLLKKMPPSYVWGNTLPRLKQNDLNLINLEAAVTTSTEIVEKVFNFKTDPKNVQVLQEGFISAVNLANNHVLDYSESGLLDTLHYLKQANIPYVGAGKNLTEAKSPIILEKKGIKVGLLGFTDNEPTWKAGANRPGTNYIDIGENIGDAIAHLKEKADLVIITLHWGPNMRLRPTSPFRNFAKQLIDQGADIIHGHSAHIFQGVEVYKEKLILYDTGDFIDDYMVDPVLRNDRSFLFQVEADKDRLLNLRLIPTLITHCQVNISSNQETLERMSFLSKEFNTTLTTDNGELLLNLI